MIEMLIDGLLPIFAVMGTGYLAGRRGMIDNRNVGQLNALVMDFALPASLFVATASTARGQLLSQWPLMTALVVSMLLLQLASYVLQRWWFRLPPGEAALQALTVALPNYAAAGLPLVAAAFGPGHSVAVALSIAAGSIFPSPVTLAMLNAGQRGAVGSGAGAVLKDVLSSLRRPVVFAPLLGVAVTLSGLSLAPVIRHAFQLLGQAAGGVALFLTGVIISAQRLRLDGNVLSGVVLKNVVHPLLVCALVRLLPMDRSTGQIAILLAALPSGFFGVLFGLRYGLDPAESGATLVASTVASLATLAVCLGALQGG